MCARIKSTSLPVLTSTGVPSLCVIRTLVRRQHHEGGPGGLGSGRYSGPGVGLGVRGRRCACQARASTDVTARRHATSHQRTHYRVPVGAATAGVATVAVTAVAAVDDGTLASDANHCIAVAAALAAAHGLPLSLVSCSTSSQ
jgi:hypothetical protein